MYEYVHKCTFRVDDLHMICTQIHYYIGVCYAAKVIRKKIVTDYSFLFWCRLAARLRGGKCHNFYLQGL